MSTSPSALGVARFPSPRPVLRRALARAREAFWLEGALGRADARSASQQGNIRRHVDAAARRIFAADRLTDENGAVGGLLLYREATRHLLAAIALERDPGTDVSPLLSASSVDGVAVLQAAGALSAVPASLHGIFEPLFNPKAFTFDDTAADELLARRAAAASLVRYLRRVVEPRTRPELVNVRRIHVGLAVLAVAGALAWFVSALFAPKNVALHKPVQASSRYVASTAPLDNSGLVNGKVEPTFGIHTDIQASWVMIDLLRPYALHRVKVYNRGDGYFDAGLPFYLELSTDGVTFHLAAERAASFSASRPWTFEAQAQRARYVRIRSDHAIALSEVEVFGRP